MSIPSVSVLMSTYNGEKYLREQIDSILNQENCQITLIVRDDGSSDDTISILKEYEGKGSLKFYIGSNLRPAKSFLGLIDIAPETDYYAFSDQDDIWLPNKLNKAINKLELDSTNHLEPKLYFSNLTAVNQNGKVIKDKILTNHIHIEFQAVLLRCGYIFGCTQVFNHALKELLKNSKKPNQQPMHDIWTAMLCSLYGQIIYDENSYIHYRQHGNNVVGAQLTFRAKLQSRIKRLTQGRAIPANIIADSLLDIVKQWPVSEEKLIILETVSHYKDNFSSKLRYIFTTGIQKQLFKRLVFEAFLVFIEKY